MIIAVVRIKSTALFAVTAPATMSILALSGTEYHRESERLYGENINLMGMGGSGIVHKQIIVDVVDVYSSTKVRDSA